MLKMRTEKKKKTNTARKNTVYYGKNQKAREKGNLQVFKELKEDTI